MKRAQAGHLALTLALAAVAGSLRPDPVSEDPTFHRDIAPIVYAACAPCHHEGEAAPFDLLTHADYAKRAKQIAIVTRDRFMPPWLPERGHVPFRDDRSLSEDERELLLRWIEAGCPEGDPADGPEPPTWESGWVLGEPDVVATMSEPFVLPAEGRDVYRNVVLRAPVDHRAFVRAVEFHPDNRAILHHALLLVDSSGGARKADDATPGPGYESMELAHGTFPDGQFVGWTPGKTPFPGTPGIAWRIDEKTDIVLQLHLRPTGKPEPIQVTIGLYLSEETPTYHPMSVRLWSRDIDIAPGETEWEVEASYRLPVDVDVLGVYPHAHYLGKDLRAYAQVPGGEPRTLLRIPSWDFNWHEEYYFAEPLSLPAGTELSLRYSFDNSADNPLNPNYPPKRVRYGAQSDDEMAEFLLVVLPTREDRPVLYHDFVRFTLETDLAWMQREAERRDAGVAFHHQLATYCLRIGRTGEAVRYYQELVEALPGRANSIARLGQALLAHGDLEAAELKLRQALELQPDHLRALAVLGLTLQELGRADEARARFERVLVLDPGSLLANTGMGELFAARERPARARRHFDRALLEDPAHVRALLGRASLELEAEKFAEAEHWCREALQVEPDSAEAHHLLGRALASSQDEDARHHLELACRFEPENTAYREVFDDHDGAND